MRDWQKRIGRFTLDVDAAICLFGAWVSVRVFGFGRIAQRIDRLTPFRELTGQNRDTMIFAVRNAVFRNERRWSLPTVCLHRAIAAQAMLRRRGVTTSLVYGAAVDSDGKLRTHAWVCDGSRPVLGHVVAKQSGFHAVAYFPKSTPTLPNDD